MEIFKLEGILIMQVKRVTKKNKYKASLKIQLSNKIISDLWKEEGFWLFTHHPPTNYPKIPSGYEKGNS